MYLLIWHLKCMEDLGRLVHVLCQEVPLRQNAGNDGQKIIEPFSAQVPVALEGHKSSDGIQLGNLCIWMKGFLRSKQSLIVLLCALLRLLTCLRLLRCLRLYMRAFRRICIKEVV